MNEPVGPTPHEPPRGVGQNIRKVKPSNRLKNAWRNSFTHLSLRVWVSKQNGQLGQWAQQWLGNKRR